HLVVDPSGGPALHELAAMDPREPRPVPELLDDVTFDRLHDSVDAKAAAHQSANHSPTVSGRYARARASQTPGARPAAEAPRVRSSARPLHRRPARWPHARTAAQTRRELPCV